MWTFGNINRFVDTTIREGDGRGGDCIETRGKVERVQYINYCTRSPVSKERQPKRYLKPLRVLRPKVCELVNDDTDNL